MHREAVRDFVVKGIPVAKGITPDVGPAITMLNPAIWGKYVNEFNPARWDRLKGSQASQYK